MPASILCPFPIICTNFDTNVVNNLSTSVMKISKRTKNLLLQECIPVGCVPSVAVAVCWGGGVCLSACWDTPPDPGSPQVCAWTLSGCGPGHTPPRCGPGQPPPNQTPNHPLGLGLDTPSVDRMTDTYKNITFANFVCGR